MCSITYNGDNLSKLVLGTVQFGLDYGIANKAGKPKLSEVKEIVDFVVSKGINCFDTASAYGNSEEVLGNVLNKNKNIYIISKLKSDEFVEKLEQSINNSLQKLKVETLYGLLLHDTKLIYNWNKDYTNSVIKLIESNKIKYFGVSIYTKDDFEQALENESISFIQIPFNIFDQRALLFDWFQRAKEKNKLIFIRSIYLQGLLFMNKDSLPENLIKAEKYLNIFEDFCDKLDLSKNELALSFVNSVAKDSLILFGCDNLSQAKQNVNVYNNLKNISEKTIQDLHDSFKDVPEDIFNPTKW